MALTTALLVLLSAGALGETPLRVMSFNLRYGTANDGENSWPNRRELVAETIQKYTPDIVGLQECLIFQADYLAESLDHYRWLGMDRDATGKGESTAILYRADLLAPVAYGNFWLSETPEAPASKSWDSSLTRMATWVRFYNMQTKTFFHFFNTHLDHRGEQARLNGVKLIAARMKKVMGPVVLTGDFNTMAEKSAPYAAMVEAGYTDSWTAAEHRSGSTVTFGSFKAPDPSADERIDWIFFGGGIRAKTCETVNFNRDGRYPSDHYPVFAELVLP
jgi:endonuclease/exonuclease/phosphatase family metal-dependent hydrolase